MGQPLKTLRHQWCLCKQMEHFQNALFSCGDLFCVTMALLVLYRAVMQKCCITCWLLRHQRTSNVVKTIIHQNDRVVRSLGLKFTSEKSQFRRPVPYPSIPVDLLELGPNLHQIQLSTVQVRWQVRVKGERVEWNKINWWKWWMENPFHPPSPLHVLKLLFCYANLGRSSWFSPGLLLSRCNTHKHSSYRNPLHGAFTIRHKTSKRKYLSDFAYISTNDLSKIC